MANSTPNDLNFQLPLIWNHYHKILSQIHKRAFWINKKQKVVFLTLSWKNSCVCTVQSKPWDFENPCSSITPPLVFWSVRLLQSWYKDFSVIPLGLWWLWSTLRWRKTGTLRTRIRFRWVWVRRGYQEDINGVLIDSGREIFIQHLWFFYNWLYVDSLVTAILLAGSIIGRANNDAWWSHRSHSWTINSASALQTWKKGFSIYLLINVVALPDKRHPLNVHGHSCSIWSPRVPHRGVRVPERSNSQSNPPSQPEQKGFIFVK